MLFRANMIHFLLFFSKIISKILSLSSSSETIICHIHLLREIEMASSKFLISLRHLISGCSCFFSFLLCFFFLFFERCRCQASAVQKIDPIEARAVNTILARWERTDLWLWGDYPKINITRDELCSGIAINDTPVDDINPAIKCDCKFHNGTVCHITLLKLYALNLARGEAFPQELSNLTYLTHLDLSRNFLTGPLPAFIGNLSSLQYLDVDGNSLSGPLPAFIGNLSLLKYLDLSGNSLTEPLSAFIGNLSLLQYLDLSRNFLTGPLPAFIGNLSSLQYMDVSRNSLIWPLSIFIGNLSSLQYMDVSRNSLSGPLAAFIRNLSSLKYLYVGVNGLTGPLPAFMGNLSSLQCLDVGENYLTGPLPAFMENLSSLEWLNVGGNLLTGPLLAFIGNLSSLQLLILGPNNFSGTLPAELGNLRNLQEWDMISSGLSGELPTSLSNLTAIQILNMSDNNFIGKLPHFIGTWPNLQVLWIQRSSISGPIPSSFFNLTQLYDLNLTHNYLTGSLPAFIGNLSALKYLDFGTNALSGPIPRELGNLKNLISLGLGPNNFSGTLPAELGGLGNLQQWDMSSSGLSGELPTSLSNLTAMEILMMSDNNFIGKIPHFIGTWSNLKVLMIQGNSISGPIPSSFLNLFNLTDLRIGDLINGSSSLRYIMEMTKLNTLILRNAKICDTLPPDFANFRSLEILDLSFNNITGNIPQSLLSLSSLKFLFLGNNSITGTLPGTKSSTLSNIDLSYNQLSGSFPPWVNDPSMVLNLVANNFFIDNSTSSVLPSGLECLQRDISCYRDSPAYYQFAINCGGGANVTSYDGTNFDIDNADLSATSYFVNNVKNWAVSIAGSFIGALNPKENYIISSQIQSQNTLDPKLFMTARMSASSLRYYGLGLENGNYTVKLQFSEIGIPDQPTWTSLARRVFDIYIQGMLKEKDFDIRKEAGGKSFTVVLKEYQAPVTNNFLEIHLFWAGKGTTNIPSPGYYGPSISAISVSPYDFIPSVSSKPPHSSSSNKNTALVVGIVCGVVVLGLTVFAILVWKHKQKNPTKDNEDSLGMTGIPNTFSYSELRTATEDFNQSNFLGEGGFGPVFKGKLHDGRMVAVKQLSVASQQGESQFTTEIATISAVQHRNLAKLYGCCIEEDKRLLVYEYLENKSLDQAIFGKNDLHLDWKTRFEICLGVARGLAYLHEESSVRIIHRDVKSSNILLDGNLAPKISDFGLAKLYDDKWTHISTKVAGTIGYLAPEYAMRGHLTEKADVFSFGVVALEVLSGRRNSDPSLEEEQSYLLDWAWHLYEQKHELELVDPSLSSYDRDEATRVIGVSLLCIQASPTLRPAMSAVVAMLTGFIEVNEVTSRPGYLTEWQFKDISSNFASDGLCESTDTRPTNSQVSVPSNADTVNL